MTGYVPGRQLQNKTADRSGSTVRSILTGRSRTGAARTGPARPHQSPRSSQAPRITALGGGQGLSASLSALRRLTTDLTAVVTVADDGGSSGRLREELGVLPPATSARRSPRSAATTTGAAPGPR